MTGLMILLRNAIASDEAIKLLVEYNLQFILIDHYSPKLPISLFMFYIILSGGRTPFAPTAFWV